MMQSEKQLVFRSNSLPDRSFSVFSDMKRKTQFCDINFHIGDQTISAHRVIIAAAIPFFHEKLSDKISPNEETDVSLDDIDPNTFVCLIEFAYSCEIIITEENVKNLLFGACILRIDEVRDVCCDFIVDRFLPENVFSFRDFASDLEFTELLHRAECYITDNFHQTSQVEEFLNLPFSFLRELLGRDDLNVQTEKHVFETLIKWVKKCPENRKNCLPELLKKIRMNFLSPGYLKNCVAEEDLIRTSLLCRDLLDEARNYHFFPEERNRSWSFTSKPRNSFAECSSSVTVGKQHMYVFEVASEYTTQSFAPRKRFWKTNEKAEFFITNGSSATVADRIYYFRACDVAMFEPLKNTFRYIKNIPCCRHFTGAAPLGQKIYICGGKEGETPSSAVGCYDTEMDSWTNIPNMLLCRESPGVVTLREKLYALGGRDETRTHNSVEMYDPLTNRWMYTASMLTERSYFGSVTLNDRIYACGGNTGCNQCTATAEVYNQYTKQWTYISPMKTVRSSLKLLVYYGKLNALGGRDSLGSNVNEVEIYDHKTDQWRFGYGTSSELSAEHAGVIVVPATFT